MQNLKSLTLPIIFYAAVWAGFIEGIEGAQNVAAFIVFAVRLPISVLFGFSEEAEKSAARRQEHPAPFAKLRHLLNLAVLITLLWQGAIVLATVFAFTWLVLANFWQKVAEHRAAQSTTTSQADPQ